MKTTRRRLVYVMVAAIVVVGLFVLMAARSPYFLYYPVIPWASFTLDGTSAVGLTAYRHRSGRTIVVIRLVPTGRETYFVNIGELNATNNDLRRNFVASCDESSIFVHRLLAVQNHEQMCHAFITIDGEKPSQQPKKIERNLIVAAKAVEFTADDGKRVGVSW